MLNFLKTRTFAFAIILSCISVAAVAPAKAADPFRGAAPAAAYRSAETRYTSNISTRSERPANDSKRRWEKAWIASWAAFVAVNLLDAHSSGGRRELNPLLRGSDGTFSARKALLIKSAFGGGFFAAQWWLARKNPETNHYKAFAIATAGAAAGLGVVAARNYGVRKVAQQDSTAAAHPYLSNTYLRNTAVATR